MRFYGRWLVGSGWNDLANPESFISILRVQRVVPMPTDTRASLLSPRPELPDDTLIDQLELPTRIGRALQIQGLTTIGEIRETPDTVLNSFPGLGRGSVKFLRDTLGLPSEDGVRCVVSKAPPVAP